MAAAAASFPVEPKEKECSVCHEDFTEPKVLPCGHLLCRRCLVSWLTTQTHALCPLCRCAIVDPKADNASVSWEDLADSFPTDVAMKAVVDASRMLNRDHSCCVCEDVAATSLCLNCGDMLCTACTKAHGKLSVSKHHEVEDLSTLTAEKLAKKQRESCAVHTKEPCKLYCSTHGASVCLLCAFSDHRQCPDVKTLESQLEESRATLRELAAILSDGETALDTAIAQLDHHLQETETRTKAAIADIGKTCDRLEAAVNACRHRLTKEAESVCDDVREAVQDGKAYLWSGQGKLKTHKRVVESWQGVETGAAVSAETVRMKSRVHTLDRSATLPPDAKTINTVTLTIDPEAVARVEQQLKDLGRLNSVPAAIVGQKRSFRFHSHHGSNISLSDCRLTAKRVSESKNYRDVLVFSAEPMVVGQLYEARVDMRDEAATGMLPLGVVTSSQVEDVTRSGAFEDCKMAISVWVSFISQHGVRTDSNLGKEMLNMPKGSRVGLYLDLDRNLFLYYNGKRIGTMSTSVPQPAYAFFTVCGSYRKITALPLTIVE